MSRLSVWILVLCLAVAGCGGGDDPAASGDGATAEGQQATTPDVPVAGDEPAAGEDGSTGAADKPPAMTEAGTDGPQPGGPPAEPEDPKDATALDIPLEKRENLDGNWVLALTQQGHNFPLLLLNLQSMDDGQVAVKLVEGSQLLMDVELTDPKVADGLLTFSLGFAGGEADFEGLLSDGVVNGNLRFGEQGVAPARLLGTSAASVANVEQKEAEGLDQLFLALGGKDKAESLSGFVADFPASPLSLIAAEQLVETGRSDQLDAEQFAKVCEEYLKLSAMWGPRLKLEAEETIQQTNQLRQAIHGEGDAREEAVSQLKEKQAEEPFDAITAWALATAAEKSGDTDQAIEQYAFLTAMPMMQRTLIGELGAETVLPAEKLSALWETKHGNTDGLDDLLDKVFEKGVGSLVTGQEPVAPRAEGEGNRVALVELFTGAQCPPCVAADLATGGLEHLYQPSELIVLRYHQHIPGPDPLTNNDNEARMYFYEGRGTPTLRVSGREFEGGGGFLAQATGVLTQLQEEITPILAETAKVDIELTATLQDGTVVVKAATGDLPAPADRLRMRVVLAERKIAFRAGNGIRMHEMIVRAMPGGPDGVKPQEGRLTLEQTVQLAELKEQLEDDLSEFEEENGIDFPVKPLALNGLTVVVFVQDEVTKEILQAAHVELAATAPAEESKPAAAPAAEKPAPAKPADEKPADDKPADDKPAEKKPEGDKAAEEKTEKPADKPEGDKPAEKKPADDTPADRDAGKKPADDTPQE